MVDLFTLWVIGFIAFVIYCAYEYFVKRTERPNGWILVGLVFLGITLFFIKTWPHG